MIQSSSLLSSQADDKINRHISSPKLVNNLTFLRLRLRQMDRAQSLREMMKKAQTEKSASSGGIEQLNGKDKAKMLKILREKKKVDAAERSIPHITPSTPAAASTMNMNAARDSPTVVKPVKHVSNLLASRSESVLKQPQQLPILPDNFFDYPEEDNESKNTQDIESSDICAPNNIEDIPCQQSFDQQQQDGPKYSQLKTPSSEISKDVTSTSSLPVGFFDNVLEDQQARGINVKEELIKKDMLQKNEMDSFLKEIESIEEVIEDVNENEEETKNLTEEAIQLAYMAKLASLYHKSVDVQNKRKFSHVEDGVHLQDQDLALEKTNEELELLINMESNPFYEQNEENNDQSSKSTSTSSHIQNDVMEALKRKKELKKKKKDKGRLLLSTNKAQRTKSEFRSINVYFEEILASLPCRCQRILLHDVLPGWSLGNSNTSMHSERCEYARNIIMLLTLLTEELWMDGTYITGKLLDLTVGNDSHGVQICCGCTSKMLKQSCGSTLAEGHWIAAGSNENKFQLMVKKWVALIRIIRINKNANLRCILASTRNPTSFKRSLSTVSLMMALNPVARMTLAGDSRVSLDYIHRNWAVELCSSSRSLCKKDPAGFFCCNHHFLVKSLPIQAFNIFATLTLWFARMRMSRLAASIDRQFCTANPGACYCFAVGRMNANIEVVFFASILPRTQSHDTRPNPKQRTHAPSSSHKSSDTGIKTTQLSCKRTALSNTGKNIYHPQQPSHRRPPLKTTIT
eukprot:gene2933-5764_t